MCDTPCIGTVERTVTLKDGTTIDYIDCEERKGYCVTIDDGTEIVVIATVENSMPPWGRVSICASPYIAFAKMMYL